MIIFRILYSTRVNEGYLMYENVTTPVVSKIWKQIRQRQDFIVSSVRMLQVDSPLNMYVIRSLDYTGSVRWQHNPALEIKGLPL